MGDLFKFLKRLRKAKAEHDSEQGARDLAQKMLTYVDIIMLIMFKAAMKDLSENFPDKEFRAKIAAAVVNDIFCAHNADSEKAMQENRESVINEISKLAVNHPDLKQPATDALRVYVKAKAALGEKVDPKLLDKATDRGFFIPDRPFPAADEYFDMAMKLHKKYSS